MLIFRPGHPILMASPPGQVMGHTESFAHLRIDESGAVYGKFFEHPSRDNFYIRPADSSEGRHVVYQEESNRTAE